MSEPDLVCEVCGTTERLGTVEDLVVCEPCSPIARLPEVLRLAFVVARGGAPEDPLRYFLEAVSAWFAGLPPLAEFGETDAEGPRRVAVALRGTDFLFRSWGLAGRNEALAYVETLNSLFARWVLDSGKPEAHDG